MSEEVSQWFYKDIICRHGILAYLGHNRGPENKKYIEILRGTHSIYNL